MRGTYLSQKFSPWRKAIYQHPVTDDADTPYCTVLCAVPTSFLPYCRAVMSQTCRGAYTKYGSERHGTTWNILWRCSVFRAVLTTFSVQYCLIHMAELYGNCISTPRLAASEVCGPPNISIDEIIKMIMSLGQIENYRA